MITKPSETLSPDEAYEQGLAAASLLADTEIGRSMAALYGHNGPNLSADAQAELESYYRILAKFGEVRPEDTLAMLDLFDRFPSAPNVGLATIRDKANWQAAEAMNRELLVVPEFLRSRGYEVEVHDSDSLGAKREIHVMVGHIDNDSHVAIMRRRRIFTATREDATKGQREKIEVDKLSLFALEVTPETPREIGVIIATLLLRKVGLDKAMFATLTAKDSLWREQAGEQLYRELGKVNKLIDMFRIQSHELANGHTRLSTPAAANYIEDLIAQGPKQRKLIPAVTSGYAHA